MKILTLDKMQVTIKTNARHNELLKMNKTVLLKKYNHGRNNNNVVVIKMKGNETFCLIFETVSVCI